MYWIALRASSNELRTAWGWRALQFTPRVAQVEEAVLLEAEASERLFGGRKRLLRRLLKGNPALELPVWAEGPTALVALSLLRLRRQNRELPERIPDDLPLDTFSAAQEHLDTLERVGCTTFGELRALPRAGVSRRFGAALLDAIDAAGGKRPERYPWIALPSSFDHQLELQWLATGTGDLLGPAQHLLTMLQAWLQARNLGVLALEFEWTLDLKRLDGKRLPPTEKLELRTAQPTQDIAHLRRLAAEQFARATLSAPANHLRLRSLETVPWGGIAASLLPEDNRPGEKLHQLVERLSVRLGEDNVRVAQPQDDHRPERMQQWLPARGAQRPQAPAMPDALYPTWLLPAPLELEVRDNVAWYGGPLRRLARLYRVETAWWEEGGAVLRDYFIARSEGAGLVWVYRERPLRFTNEFRWYLQGVYA
ncbi:DNA polymerase Y family protein [Ramlibacter sp. XY19]|uniref:DNA polymerase Y family protein n=1 Tax=Ramlibacter paludis TaxID=2908000 RepID=UPI0023DACE94|nr:DNA polymerase Y family protein [Ramlibacter paludis]MCG2592928.1 DNA polymerase Y family protein [Ramlibacter paludis]